jgi:ribonuclease HI
VKIFTDASKANSGEIAAAFYVPERSVSRSYRLTDHASVFAGEIAAIRQALTWLATEGSQQISSAVIFSDALSAVSAIGSHSLGAQTNSISEIHRLIDDCKQEIITIAWIPSHIGIEENDAVDQLAKAGIASAENEIDVELDLQEVRNKIQTWTIEIWQAEYLAENKSQHYKEIQPIVSKKIKYTNSNREKEVTITRLRLGKCRLNHQMYIKKLHVDGLCETCQVEETIEHFLLNCGGTKIGETIRDYCTKHKLTCTVKTALSNEKLIDAFYPLINRQI